MAFLNQVLLHTSSALTSLLSTVSTSTFTLEDFPTLDCGYDFSQHSDLVLSQAFNGFVSKVSLAIKR